MKQNVPNSITLGRLFLAVIAFVLMFSNYWLIASIILLVAVLMDILDGRMARRLDQVTKQGVFLDVMVDKIVIISTFLIIGFEINSWFFYLGLMMLLREYSMDTMRAIAASQSKVISADKFSKIKGVLFMVAMMGMIFNKVLVDKMLLQYVFLALASIAMLLAYMTLVRFFFKYKELMLKE